MINKKIVNEALNHGIHIPTVLLPNKSIALEKWAVVACDQYTSQPSYWTEVEKHVANSPSTFNLIIPEVYLNEENIDTRITSTNKYMQQYINNKVLDTEFEGFVFLERQMTNGTLRRGLIIGIDLEKYDFSEDSHSLIRASEKTVIERLPARIKIRENAIIELPHTMLLISDQSNTVFSPIIKAKSSLEKLYDFDLMMNGGNIKGYRIDNEELLIKIITALKNLKNEILFAVGDGNHSLASSKCHWETLKKVLPKDALCSHPSRFALVEIVNVFEESISFEPIHRVLFDIDVENVVSSLIDNFSESNLKYYKDISDTEYMNLKVQNKFHKIFHLIAKDRKSCIILEKSKFNLEVSELQQFLDSYLKNNKSIKIDYIHGEDVVKKLCSNANNIGFLLPYIDKSDFFKTIIKDGVFPKKTFSIGSANEKRFYLECRKIK